MSSENIHPIFDTILQRQHKEALIEQKGMVIWMTGLSGSGKSTLARAFERSLHQHGKLTILLDGDNLRSGINNNLGFSAAERTENIRRASEVAKLFLNNGIITICSLISPTIAIRELARQVIGPEDFYEVYVNCPIEECIKRDVKGLYKKALSGEIKNFTGLDAPYEAPKNPFVEVQTDQLSLEYSHQKLWDGFAKKLSFVI